MLKDLEKELKRYAKEERGKLLQGFFKTGPGEYGEGDVFLGLTMGEQRLLAKKFSGLAINDIQTLLDSEIHEKRMVSLLVLMERYKKADEKGKEKIFDFYIKNARKVSNWDLVDVTCPHVVGDFLLNKNREVLYKLAKSDNLWERRISIISTAAFIRNNDFSDTFKIAKILLKDKHDLIHKAVGWMLREVGKKDQEVLEIFLKKHYKQMPRTMLRYSIERFEERKRKSYLRGEV